MKQDIRLLAVFLCTVVFAHVLLFQNTTYTLHYSVGEFDGDRSAFGLSRDQYVQYLHSLGDYRADAITGTKISFFNVLPYWSINVVYCLYFVIAIVMLTKLPKKATATRNELQ